MGELVARFQAWIIVGALVLAVGVGAACAWLWQANAYGKDLADQSADFVKQLADKDAQHGREREDAVAAALDQLQAHQDQRRSLEDRLQVLDQTHYTEMQDAQNDRTRLRDRLATTELRLSVLVAGLGSAASGDRGLRETTGTSGLVDGPARVELDPAHAQRIVAITGDGDDGLKALQACQAYVAAVIK